MLPPGSRPSNCSTQPTFEKLQRHEEQPPMQVPVRKLCFVGLPRFLLLWPNPPSLKVEYHHISWHVIDIDILHGFQMSVFFLLAYDWSFCSDGFIRLPTSLNIDEYSIIIYIGILSYIGMSLLSWWLPWIWICRANLDAAKTWNGLHALCLKDEHRVRARPQMWPKWIVLVMICSCIEAAASHKEQSPRFAPISIAWTLKSRTPPADLLAGFWRLLAIAHGSWCQAACALVRCKRRARVCTTRRIDSWWLSGLGW